MSAFKVMSSSTKTAEKDDLTKLISRLERDLYNTDVKLVPILTRMDEIDLILDRTNAKLGKLPKAIAIVVKSLNELEAPIAGFFKDVETLKEHHHPGARDFQRKVESLFFRRKAYHDRATNRLPLRIEELRKSKFRRVEEDIEWVRARSERLASINIVAQLETLRKMHETHKIENRDILDFRQEVEACISRRFDICPDDSFEYCEQLRILKSEYQQLRDISASRTVALDSLVDLMSLNTDL